MNSEIVDLYSEFKQYRRNFKFEEFDNDKLRDFFNKFENIYFSIDEDSFLKYKINSTMYYIKRLLKYNIPFNEYIRNTIGTDLTEIPHGYIHDLHKKIAHKFSGFGIDYRDAKAAQNFLCKCDIPNYVDKLFNEKDIFISKIASVVELPNLNNIDIEFINEDIPYSYYMTVNGDSYILKINKRSKNFHNYYNLKLAIIHELCGHAVQIMSWNYHASKGEFGRELCCIEDYGPEIFILEGIADSLIYYLYEDQIDERMEIELLIDELNHCIQNNSFLKLSKGEAIENVLAYYKSNYFWEEDAQIESRFVKFLNNPFYTANLCVYCPALLKFKHINDSLSSDEKVKFLKHIYSKPLSYSDLKKYCSKNFQLRTI